MRKPRNKKPVIGANKANSNTSTGAEAVETKFIAKTDPVVLFENADLFVINKPAGLVVHSDGKTKEPSLCDWILANYPKLKGVGEPSRTPEGVSIDRPGIVHRIDRDTSGIMVIAKTQESFEYLKEQFKGRTIKKTYNTFVWGLVKEDKGKIERPIGRSRGDFRKWSAERYARGELRDAVTEYKVLARKSSEEGSNKKEKIPLNFTYLEVHPLTGRTHQIRVHMKAINHPVVGDELYAPNHPKVLGFDRLALHARSIEFVGPKGIKVSVEAPLPEDFEKAIQAFTN